MFDESSLHLGNVSGPLDVSGIVPLDESGASSNPGIRDLRRMLKNRPRQPSFFSGPCTRGARRRSIEQDAQRRALLAGESPTERLFKRKVSSSSTPISRDERAASVDMAKFADDAPLVRGADGAVYHGVNGVDAATVKQVIEMCARQVDESKEVVEDPLLGKLPSFDLATASGSQHSEAWRSKYAESSDSWLVTQHVPAAHSISAGVADDEVFPSFSLSWLFILFSSLFRRLLLVAQVWKSLRAARWSLTPPWTLCRRRQPHPV